MKKQWGTIVAIILLLLVAVFAVMNVESVPVNFGFASVSSPLIIIIFASLLIGALTTVLIATGSAFRDRKKMKSYEKNLDEAEKEKQAAVDNVKSDYEQQMNEKDSKIQEQQRRIDMLEEELKNNTDSTDSIPINSRSQKSRNNHS